MPHVIPASDPHFGQYWQRLMDSDPLQNPLYAPTRGQAGGDRAEGEPAEEDPVDYDDYSFLVVADDEPVFGCSLTAHREADGRRCLGYFGIEASTLVNRRCMKASSNQFDAEAVEVLQEHFAELMARCQPDALDYLDPVACGLMSPVTQLLLARGGIPTVFEARQINLALSEQALWRLLSEPCRELINWGQERLDTRITSGAAIDALDTRLPRLLAEDPGSQRRANRRHWQTCRRLVRQGQGFVVQAQGVGLATGTSGVDKAAEPVSALFVHNARTCHYVVDDSALDDPPQPVLHALIWQAMLHSKALGCSRFDLGRSANAVDRAQTAATLDPAAFGGAPQTRVKVSLTQ